MSTYKQLTKHPITGEWEFAIWHDDYFGDHNYGIEFPSDKKVFDQQTVKLETCDSVCYRCKEVHRCKKLTQDE